MKSVVIQSSGFRHYFNNSCRVYTIIILIMFLPVFFQCNTTDPPSDENTEALFSDDFEGDELNTKWNWSKEPGEWDLGLIRDGWLTWTGELNSNLWCSDETTILYQIIEKNTDFDISTKIYCEWGNNLSDIAGLIVKFPTVDNWINIKFWMQGNGTGRLEFQKKCTDLISPVPGTESSGGTRDMYLRLVKEGNDYTGYYKNSNDDEWILIGSTEGIESFPIHVGLFGGVDQGDGNLLIQYDFFHK